MPVARYIVSLVSVTGLGLGEVAGRGAYFDGFSGQLAADADEGFEKQFRLGIGRDGVR